MACDPYSLIFIIIFTVPPKSVKMYFLPSKNAEPEEIPDDGRIILQKGKENGIRCEVRKKHCLRKIWYHINMATFKETAFFHYVGCLLDDEDIT